MADAINPRLRGSETLANFVYSGCTWGAVSGFNGTMTGGTIYVNGYRTIVSGVGSNTFTASSDTYIDIDYLGNVTYNAVANNATAPALTANSVRVAKVVTSGSAITTITQTGWDGNGIPIYNTSIRPIILGTASITGNITTQATSATQATGLTSTVNISIGGRTIKVTVSGGNLSVGTNAKNIYVNLWRGTVGSGTKLSEAQFTSATANYSVPITLIATDTPSAGPVTYNVGYLTDAGPVILTWNVSATSPAILLVENM